MATTVSYLRKGTKPAPAARLVTGAAVVAALTLRDRPAHRVASRLRTTPRSSSSRPAPRPTSPHRCCRAPTVPCCALRAATSTRAAAFVVDPNTGQAREVSLTPRRADGEVDYGPDRNSELAANVSRVQQLLNTLAASKPFDLLAIIAQAVRVTTHPGTLLVLSSGLSTAGGFDLRQVGWGADPRTAAVSLAQPGTAAPPDRLESRLLRPRGHERDAARPVHLPAHHTHPLLAGPVSRGRRGLLLR